MTRTSRFVTILIGAALLLSAAPPRPAASQAALVDHTIFVPVMPSEAVLGPLVPILSPTTRILTEISMRVLAQVSPDQSHFTFTETTSELWDLEPGWIIAGGVSVAAPSGFLRKVEDVTLEDGQVILTTSRASLDETVRQGSLVFDLELTPDQIHDWELNAGIQQAEGQALALEFDRLVLWDEDGSPDSADDQIIASGRVEFRPRIQLSCAFHTFTPVCSRFTEQLTSTTDLQIVSMVEGTLPADFKIQLGTFQFNPVTILIGSLPVVIVPRMVIWLGADGQIFTGNRLGALQTISGTAGIQSTAGEWQGVADFLHTEQHDQPWSSAGTDFRGSVAWVVEALFYGLDGPQVETHSMLHLQAGTLLTPAWQLNASLQAAVRLPTAAIGPKMAEVQDTLTAYQKTIDVSEGGEESPSDKFHPYPLNQETGVFLDACLAWHNTFNDKAFTYTVYLEPEDPTPDTIIAKEVSGSIYIIPEERAPNTTYYWRLLARDAAGNQFLGPVWSFTTGDFLPVRGRVVDSDNLPIGQTTIHTYQTGLESQMFFVRDNGTFVASVPRLSGLEWTFVLQWSCASQVSDPQTCGMKDYFLRNSFETIQVPQTSELVFVFEKTNTYLSGSVTDRLGKPIRAYITAYRDDRAYTNAASSADGSFSMPIEDGVWIVYASYGNDSSQVVTVTIMDGIPSPASITLKVE